MGVFTQPASNIKGFAAKFAHKSASASCVNCTLRSLVQVSATLKTITTATGCHFPSPQAHRVTAGVAGVIAAKDQSSNQWFSDSTISETDSGVSDLLPNCEGFRQTELNWNYWLHRQNDQTKKRDMYSGDKGNCEQPVWSAVAPCLCIDLFVPSTVVHSSLVLAEAETIKKIASCYWFCRLKATAMEFSVLC